MFASNIYILCTIFNDFFVKVLAQIEFCLKFLDNIWEGIWPSCTYGPGATMDEMTVCRVNYPDAIIG